MRDREIAACEAYRRMKPFELPMRDRESDRYTRSPPDFGFELPMRDRELTVKVMGHSILLVRTPHEGSRDRREPADRRTKRRFELPMRDRETKEERTKRLQGKGSNSP